MITDDRLKFARRCPAGSTWQTDASRFFEPEVAEALLARGAEDFGADLPPLARIRLPHARAILLVSALDPNRPTRAFGLADLGYGPEIGGIDLAQIGEILRQDGWVLSPDTDFDAGGHRLSDFFTGAARA